MGRLVGNDLAKWIDLQTVPYTSRFSRLLVFKGGDGLAVFRVAYEQPLEESLVLKGIRPVVNGELLQWVSADEYGVYASCGGRLVVAGDSVFAFGFPPGSGLDGTDSTGRAVHWEIDSDGCADLGLGSIGDDITYVVADEDSRTESWMGHCPNVAEAWDSLVRFCWWVLGVNTLVLAAPDGDITAVVPSKIGYVGLWQWDAYFIATGLRHGDPGLAKQQLLAAFAYQLPDGQLPDVVFDGGVLASSDDLPLADLENLRALGSPSLGSRSVPLTKPPLAALAVEKLAEFDFGASKDFCDALLRNHHWWFTRSDIGGVPVYLHPYSSGLDDSPIFDHSRLLVSPDLLSYLIVSDRILARHLMRIGCEQAAEVCLARAAYCREQLLMLWDEELGYFVALDEDSQRVKVETCVSLMPLLVDDLPLSIYESLVDKLSNPSKFHASFSIPTVALGEADFSEDRMWRGPVWININWLIAEGLRANGFGDQAEKLMRGSLEMLLSSGPCEYFRPDNGARPSRATTMFGWSAALAIDMAVSLS